MFLILLLPMALGQTSLRGREVKVTTVAHRPFIMPNNLSSGERWPEKFHEIVHHVLFVIVMNVIFNFPSRSREPKNLSRSPLQNPPFLLRLDLMSCTF